MLLQLLRFEILYQAKQRALPIAGLLALSMGYFLGQAGNAPALVDFNAPFQISYFTGNFTLFSVFIIMFFAVSGVIRDHKFQMESLIYSSSLKKFHFFGSRFIGVFLFSVLTFSLFLPGYWLGVSLSDLDPDRVAPFQWKSYLWPFIFIIVPNIFICTSLLFSASLLTKNNVVVYASAILIYILYFVVGIFSNSPMFASSLPASPEQMRMAALLDPFAISTFFEHTQFWTYFEKSNSFLSFSGNYFWNRFLWVGFAFVILGITYRLFSFRLIKEQKKNKGKIEATQEISQAYQTSKIQIGWTSQWRALGASVQIDVQEIIRSLPFMAILLVLLVALALELYAKFFESGLNEETLYPYTHLVIESVIDIIPILSKILIVFYSGELVWKAKERKFNGIVHTTAASNWVFFTSKLVTLVLIPMLLIGTLVTVCLGFQLIKGFTDIDFTAYLLLFYHYGTPALVLSMMAIFVQTVVKQKYLGMGLTGAIILILTTPLSYNLGIEHPMLRIGVMPTISYSDMSGYGIQAQSFGLYAGYWMVFGFILSILSLKLWNRQLVDSKLFGGISSLKQWKPTEIIVLSIAIAAFSVIGSQLYRKLDGNYKTKEDQLDYAEQYERKLKQYENLSKLTYVSMKTAVDLYPEEEKYTVYADYQLVNKNEVPVTQVLVTEKKRLTQIKLEGAKLIFKDTALGAYLFTFDPPILPQQTTQLRYELTHQSRPFKPDYSIVKNGTYQRHEFFEPQLEYQKRLEIIDPYERKKRGLAVKSKLAKAVKKNTGSSIERGDVHFETIVSTSKDQLVLAPGDLIKQWTKGDRNYFHYKYPEPAIPILSYSSANYTVKAQSCDSLEIDYYYHPGHERNHTIIAESTCAALAYCQEHFGHYPLRRLSVAEIPSSFPIDGVAQPGLVSLVEDKLYLIDINDPNSFNQVAKRTAKEVAHQWWGMILPPKRAPGGGFLTFGLSEYTSSVILEEMYGPGAVWESSKIFNENYFRGRTFATAKEPPLYLERRENYLMKGKSGLVLLAIRDLLGEDKLNIALQKLINQHKQATEYTINTQNFMAALHEVSPAQYHQLLDEWMKEIIRYELKVQDVDSKRLQTGQYEITLTISAQRFKTLPSGKEVAIGIDEPIKIGCFDKHPGELSKTAEISYLQSHPINQDLTTVRFVVDTLPRYIGVDPFLTRLDRNYADNLKELEE